MFTFLLVVQALIAASLVGVILMQQSEGGGLGMGGSPTGLMSARGAANFLTQATAWLALTFVGLSIAMAVYATQKAAPTTIDTSLARKPVPTAPVAPVPVVPLSGDAASQPVPSPTTPVPATAPEPVVPLAAAKVETQPRVNRTAPEPKPAVAAPRQMAPKPVVVAPPPVTSTVPAPSPTQTVPPAENK
jgi:preprotein translocase subunit SecG